MLSYGSQSYVKVSTKVQLLSSDLYFLFGFDMLFLCIKKFMCLSL